MSRRITIKRKRSTFNEELRKRLKAEQKVKEEKTFDVDAFLDRMDKFLKKEFAKYGMKYTTYEGKRIE